MKCHLVSFSILTRHPWIYTSWKTKLSKERLQISAIASSTDKRSITGTFIITLSGKSLPMQLIYCCKTKQSLPRLKFPESFSLSANPKYFSNKAESLKAIKEIILLYVKQQQRQELEKPDQASILIMDVFRGQMTEEVVSMLRTNNICWLRFQTTWRICCNPTIQQWMATVSLSWRECLLSGIASKSRKPCLMEKK